jgi:hypothetical protein
VAQVPFTQWLSVFAPELVALIDLLFSPELVITANFCAGEPPDPGTAPTLLDYARAVVDIQYRSVITEYWRNAYKQALWSDYCQCNSSPPPPGAYDARINALVPYRFWPMHDTTAGNDVLETVHGQDATTQGSVTKGSAGIIPGSSGDSFLFGSGGIVNWTIGAPPVDLAPTSVWTWEFYFKTTVSGRTQSLISATPTVSGGREVELVIDALDRLSLSLAGLTADGSPAYTITSAVLPTNVVHQVDVIFNGPAGTTDLYLDAAHVGQIAQPWTRDLLGASYLEMGAANVGGNTYYLAGNMECVSFFPRALSATDMADNLAAGGGTSVVFNPVTPTDPGLPPIPTASCSTIADLCVELNVIERLLRGIATVGVPSTPLGVFSLSEGAIHAGLHDTGLLTLVSGLAVKFTMTTVPTTIGSEIGDPLIMFEAGWLTPFSSEGPSSSTLITFETQVVWLPPATIQLGYTLHPGIVATVTELGRGP